MIKAIFYFFLLFFMMTGCSSPPKREYSKKNLELRANHYFNRAEFYRQNLNYKESLEFYKIASKLYLLRGSRKKYVISQLKIAFIYLKQDNLKGFNRILYKVKKINEIENLNLQLDIQSIWARMLYHTGQKEEANFLIKQLCQKFQDNPEKKIYYDFYYASHNTKALHKSQIPQLEESLKFLQGQFNSGKLKAVEVFVFSKFTFAKILIHFNKLKEAESLLADTQNLFKELEIPAQNVKVYEAFIHLYQKSKNKKKENYYRGLLDYFNQSYNERFY